MSIGMGALVVSEKFDANETAFFAKELESIESTLYEVKRKELKYRTYIPVSSSDPEGAETVTYRMMDQVGMAKIISNYGSDLPRSDVFGTEHTQPVRSIGSSFAFSDQEIRAASMAGKPLDSLKASSNRRARREKESDIAWNGDEEHGLLGLLDNENIPVVATPTGVSGFLWSQKTPDEILNDIRILTSGVRQDSKGIHEIDTLLLPIEHYDILANTPRSSLSDVTLLKFIKDPGNSFGITTVDWLPDELDLRFVGGTKNGILGYERSAEVLQQRIPMEQRTKPVEVRGLENIINTESRHGGVVVRYPLALRIMTGV
jgi:hypothetical protein